MEKEEYNYSTFRVYIDITAHKYDHYIQYFKCVKCGKENIKESAREVPLSEYEKRGIIK